MKPIIGIITRFDKNKTNKDIVLVYKAVVDAVYNNDSVPVAIIPKDESTNDIKDLYTLIDMCDGIILQGGNDVLDYDVEIVKYIHKKDIPVLGICLGMQSMNVALGGTMEEIGNESHLKLDDTLHEINIVKGTKIYDIVKQDKLNVNSRHISYIKDTPLLISGYNDVIEITEDPNKRFFIGVQYHIENMITYDKEEDKIFKYFISVCKEYMCEFKSNK